MNMFDFSFLIIIGMFIGFQLNDLYLKYYKIHNLSLKESESLIPRYVMLLNYRKKKVLEKSINV